MKRTHARLAQTTIALIALTAAMSAASASAGTTLTFPNSNAACVAQAWVPFNTDPEVESGALGALLSTDGNPRNGALRQNDGDCRR